MAWVRSSKAPKLERRAGPNPDQTLWTPAVLGERVWLDWYADDAGEGPVVALTSRQGNLTATQIDATKRPIRLEDGELDFSGGKCLNIPHQGSEYIAHRAILMLFKPQAPTGRDGSLFYVNEITGGIYARQPAITYLREAGQIAVQWRDPTNFNKLEFTPVWGNWQCVMSRRVDGTHRASLNGAPELFTGANICLGKNNVFGKGLIGDFRPRSIDFALDCIVILQDELTQAETDKLVGWACHRRGILLPNGHPYKNAPPRIELTDTRLPFVESTQAEWNAFASYIKEDKGTRRRYERSVRAPLDLTGFSLEYEDHFTTNTVTDEITGTGPWYAPVHFTATGDAAAAKVTDTEVYRQSGSEFILRMTNPGSGWKSGMFQSVNLNGKGNTWDLRGGGIYFECSFRANGDGDKAWTVFWFKSVNEYYRLTESRLEVDIVEGYSVDPDGHHQAVHNWPARRLVPERLTKHRWAGNYTGLSGAWGRPTNVLFDNLQHTYGCMVEVDWTKMFFDGRELGRFRTPIEFMQPVFLLVSLARKRDNGRIDGTAYEMGIDYVRVFRK